MKFRCCKKLGVGFLRSHVFGLQTDVQMDACCRHNEITDSRLNHSSFLFEHPTINNLSQANSDRLNDLELNAGFQS